MLNVQQDDLVLDLIAEAWPMSPSRFALPGRVARDVPGGPIAWMLPDVSRLLSEHLDESARDFAIRARSFIEDHAFVDSDGDWLRDERRTDTVERLIDTVTKVHRVLNRDDAPQGWHHPPSPSHRFG